MHYIMLDEKTVKPLTKNGNKRVIAMLNNEVELHCALMPKKEGGYFINIGSTTCKKLKLKEGFKLNVSLTIDTSEYQFEMPAELKEVLATDPAANKVFQNLSEGNKRGLMYLVSQVKSSDKKIERALLIAEKIKAGIVSPRMVMR